MIATPFIRKASEHFDVTLLAKPFATELQPRFWPGISVIPFTAPWTAFSHKYNLFTWHWRAVFSVWRYLFNEKFDVGLSARWDPRDHFLLKCSGARARLGFPRTGSSVFLTTPLEQPAPLEHRYENWRVIGKALKLEPEPLSSLAFPRVKKSSTVLLHTGAAQAVRVWPLENFQAIARKLRQLGYEVKVVCNPDQLEWWRANGERDIQIPATITELLSMLDDSGVFIGNDSGPGHLAAFCGVPTFSFFGPQMAEWFAPMHPSAEVLEGKACPYKPCSDYCRFPRPICLANVTEGEAWPRIKAFVEKNIRLQPSRTLVTAH